jgi:hypothetical protein
MPKSIIGPIFIIAGPTWVVTRIWQKLNTVEREVKLIVIDFWQLFSHIIGETSLIVTHYWRNQTL